MSTPLATFLADVRNIWETVQFKIDEKFRDISIHSLPYFFFQQ